jgi:hypothetical protein
VQFLLATTTAKFFIPILKRYAITKHYGIQQFIKSEYLELNDHVLSKGKRFLEVKG